MLRKRNRNLSLNERIRERITTTKKVEPPKPHS